MDASGPFFFCFLSIIQPPLRRLPRFFHLPLQTRQCRDQIRIYSLSIPPSNTLRLYQVKQRELCRNFSIPDARFYTWRKKYGGMEVSEARWFKALKEKNARLEQLLIEAKLDSKAFWAENPREQAQGRAQHAVPKPQRKNPGLIETGVFT